MFKLNRKAIIHKIRNVRWIATVTGLKMLETKKLGTNRENTAIAMCTVAIPITNRSVKHRRTVHNSGVQTMTKRT